MSLFVDSLPTPFPPRVPPVAPARGPLYVDLDGTLLSTNVLWEGVLRACLQHPWRAWRLPWGLLRGRAAFKRAVASAVTLDPARLPYRATVLALIADARAEGRSVVLATGADYQVAYDVAAHLGGFDGVLSSDGHVNLTGRTKLAAMRLHAAGPAFGYVGNSQADLALLDAATDGYLVGASARVARLAARHSRPPQLLGTVHSFRRVVGRTLRVHQWAKNSLLVVPALLSHLPWTGAAVFTMLMAVMAFSFAASSVYIVNDLLDLELDRMHPHKSGRPIASGACGLPHAVGLGGICILGSFGLAASFLPRSFGAVLVCYMLLSHAYSFRLKRIPVLDVFILAGLYTIRLVAGGVALHVVLSPLLLWFSLFFFLSLAFAKRYTELHGKRQRRDSSEGRGGYRLGDLSLIRVVGPAAGYCSVLVFAQYLQSPAVQALYRTPHFLWPVGAMLVFWITRVWLLAQRGELHHDPVVFALRDRTSYALGLAIVGCGLLARNV